MSMTFTRREASARNSRSAVPGTPTMLSPRSVSSVMSPTERDALGRHARRRRRLREISVPGADGIERVLDQNRNRFARPPGAIVAECSTLAPKYDSSIASS